jgi:hypothetical protein
MRNGNICAFNIRSGSALHFCDVRVVSAFHPIATKSRTPLKRHASTVQACKSDGAAPL